MLYLNQENFEKEVSEGVTAVDFYADWCMPCKMMGPLFEKLSKEYQGKMKFAKVDTQKETELPGKFEIMGIPCIIVFKDGKEAGRIVGMMPEEALKEKLNAYL
jgi:thioredoxin 1